MFGPNDRRHFLAHAAGATALAGPGLSFWSKLAAKAPDLKKQNKSLIILWMGGGPSTIDLWDMKPGQPTGGEHKPIKTAVSGIEINQYLPLVGKQMNHLNIVRSLTTTEGDHNRGTFLMSTGRPQNPLAEFPHMGSVLSYTYAQDLEAMKHMDLPLFISVSGGRIGPGFLGMKYAPFNIQNPGTLPEGVSPPGDVSNRNGMERRKVLFETLESSFKTNTPGDAAQAHRDVYGKAMQLVASNRTELFRLTSDKDRADVQKYGDSTFGRGCLLARKLVEAGVGCVEVNLGGWDMHNGIFAALARTLPTLDQGMAALTEDLAASGRLKNTVILWMGEFGRTPRINPNGGRDHYPRAWSVVVGGGSLKGGQVVGSTSADGGEAKDNPVKVGNLFATVYTGLGLDLETHGTVRDNLGRPRPPAANPLPGGGEEKAPPIKQLI